MGFRRAKSTQGNKNCQKNIFEDDPVPGHHPRALRACQKRSFDDVSTVGPEQKEVSAFDKRTDHRKALD